MTLSLRVRIGRLRIDAEEGGGLIVVRGREEAADEPAGAG